MANQCDDQFLRQLLEERGYYRKWNAEVMADILLPHIQENNPPEENVPLSNFKQECGNKAALYLIKEFLRNMGMQSTEKILEAEAGLEGTECDFAETLSTKFPLLQMSTPDNVQPPLLAQIVYLWRMDYLNRKSQMKKAGSSCGMGR